MQTKKLLLCFSIFILSFSLSFGQSWLWVKQSNNDSTNVYTQCDPFSVATDPSGNIFETGVYEGKMSFGSYSLTAIMGNANAFLVKYDQNGNVLWAKNSLAPSGGDCISYAVTTDKWGNAYITGYYVHPKIIFGDDTLKNGSISNNSYFLTKYGPNGNAIWAKNAVPATVLDLVDGLSVATDDSGNIFVTGNFTDSIKFGSFLLTSGFNYSQSSFLVKYDSAGNVKWAAASINASTYGTAYSGSSSVCTDHNGGIYITGDFNDSIKFGLTTLISSRSTFYLAKYDENGNVTWALQGELNGTASTDEGVSISSDLFNNIYVAGTYTDSVQFGSYSIINSTQSTFILKYNSSGNLQWAKTTIGKGILSQPYSISANKFWEFYLCGRYIDTIRFDNVKLVSDSIWPSYLIKFDSTGHAICGTGINNNNDDANALVSDPLKDNVYFGGDADGDIDLKHVLCLFGQDTVQGYLEVGFLGKWDCNSTSGMDEIPELTSAITLFPNPNTGKFIVACHPADIAGSQPIIEIYNMIGQKIYNETLNQVQGDNTIDIVNQPNGIYLYRLLKEDGTLIGSGKLIIQK